MKKFNLILCALIINLSFAYSPINAENKPGSVNVPGYKSKSTSKDKTGETAEIVIGIIILTALVGTVLSCYATDCVAKWNAQKELAIKQAQLTEQTITQIRDKLSNIAINPNKLPEVAKNLRLLKDNKNVSDLGKSLDAFKSSVEKLIYDKSGLSVDEFISRIVASDFFEDNVLKNKIIEHFQLDKDLIQNIENFNKLKLGVSYDTFNYVKSVIKEYLESPPAIYDDSVGEVVRMIGEMIKGNPNELDNVLNNYLADVLENSPEEVQSKIKNNVRKFFEQSGQLEQSKLQQEPTAKPSELPTIYDPAKTFMPESDVTGSVGSDLPTGTTKDVKPIDLGTGTLGQYDVAPKYDAPAPPGGLPSGEMLEGVL